MTTKGESSFSIFQLKDELSELFRGNRCRFAYLVGSIARHDSHPMSDIDILVSIPDFESRSGDALLDFILEITAIAEKITGIDTVDVAFLENLPIQVQYSMIKNGIVLFEESWEDRTDFEIQLMKEYFDYAIWYEQYLNLTLEKDE